MFLSRWTLKQGLVVAREVEIIAALHSWHVALGGGVMLNGTSEHDLDLIFYPDKAHPSIDLKKRKEILCQFLTNMGWEIYRSSAEMRTFWVKRYGPDHDQKCVEVWKDPKGRRVDFIWMSV